MVTDSSAPCIPFPGFEGSVNVAMGDVDGDGILDLIVGSGPDRAPEVVAYAGASLRGKGVFGTELARFQAFEDTARGGVNVAAAQIDGTNSDNIIVGSGPGVPSEVKVYQSQLSSSPGVVPALFASFKPYGDDRSGVSIATGFVDFSTGRESIVTAPGAGSATEVKVFAFPLFKPNGKAAEGSAQAAGTEQPVNTASFMPFGRNYRGGVSLATGWLAGSLGGAKRIVVSQLTDRGSVKIFSSGSALDGGPPLYLQSPMDHAHSTHFREIAAFEPFDGFCRYMGRHDQHDDGRQSAGQRRCGWRRRRKCCSNTSSSRPNAQSTTLQAVRLGQVWSGKGSQPAILGGD